ncbi:MAG: DMT family transporter [Betaproteobacteria bacterium]|nr:MAG: DMT family transporter [Betaproteobacteria bacterium]
MSTQTTPALHRRAVITLIFCCFLWSIAGVVTRNLDSAKSFEATFWRSFFCGVSLIIWFVWNERGAAWQHIVSSGRAGFISGVCWAVMFTCFMIALTLTSTANTLIVNSLSPLITALLAWIVLKSPIPGRTWLAIAVAIIGMALMFGSALEGKSGAALGMMIAFGVPVAAAVNLINLKKAGAQIDLAPAVLIGAIISCAITLPLSLPFSASLKDVALLALLGVFQLAIPCVLLIRAVKHLSAPETALLGMLEIIMGPLWTWLFAGETPALLTLVGATIVIAALVLNELMPERRSTVVQSPAK